MKNLLAILALLPALAFAGGETKKVCSQDAKTKKEVCKMVKVHKKLEGTAIPPKK
jgi:hypothetical protein